MQELFKTSTILSYMSFGSVLKKVRKERGVTQVQLAFQLGVTQATVARYEKGVMTPEVKRVSLIARFLGVSVQELLEEKELSNFSAVTHSHGNSRQTKINAIFQKLTISDQKAILKNAEWLAEKGKKRVSA